MLPSKSLWMNLNVDVVSSVVNIDSENRYCLDSFGRKGKEREPLEMNFRNHYLQRPTCCSVKVNEWRCWNHRMYDAPPITRWKFARSIQLRFIRIDSKGVQQTAIIMLWLLIFNVHGVVVTNRIESNRIESNQIYGWRFRIPLIKRKSGSTVRLLSFGRTGITKWRMDGVSVCPTSHRTRRRRRRQIPRFRTRQQ